MFEKLFDYYYNSKIPNFSTPLNKEYNDDNYINYIIKQINEDIRFLDIIIFMFSKCKNNMDFVFKDTVKKYILNYNYKTSINLINANHTNKDINNNNNTYNYSDDDKNIKILLNKIDIPNNTNIETNIENKEYDTFEDIKL